MPGLLTTSTKQRTVEGAAEFPCAL